MARGKKSGEANTPLIISLVFFILTSIGLGVMYYLSNGAIDAEKAKATEAANKTTAAEKAMKESQDIAKLHRSFLGIATEDEKAYLASPDPATKDAVRAEHTKLLAAVNTSIRDAVNKERPAFEKLGAGFDLDAAQVFTWNWPEGGALPSSPSPLPLSGRLVKSVAEREMTIKLTGVEVTNARAELTAAAAEKKRYTDAISKLEKDLGTEIKALSDAKLKVEEDKKAAIGNLEKESAELRKEKVAASNKVEEIELQKKQIEEQLANTKATLNRLEEITADINNQKKGAFSFNPIHGEVIKRRGDSKIVEISIGSSSNLKPGQTFKVQPASTKLEGLGSRKKQIVDSYGKTVVTDEEASKGTLEVVDVLGPNLATARITDEPEPIRDSILPGDLLYNPLWKKGASDHVVLFGIFDLDGDGNDDIRDTAVKLERQGIIVDGYYSLATRKWESLDPNNKKPGPTQSTTYAIKGWIPEPNTQSFVAGSVADIVTAINTASGDAKLKGCKEVKALEFFPGIGVKLSSSITDMTVNQAAVKFLREPSAQPMK
jgi:hypothetical protein